jgi:PAS domain-containing protein
MPDRPIELILARNFITALSAPAFLVDGTGEIAFYNEAAGGLLGRRFEEGGPMTAEEWTRDFGPLDDDGVPIPYDQLEITQVLRGNRPGHDAFCIRAADGTQHAIESTGIPIVGTSGYQGALVVFWPREDGTPG